MGAVFMVMMKYGVVTDLHSGDTCREGKLLALNEFGSRGGVELENNTDVRLGVMIPAMPGFLELRCVLAVAMLFKACMAR